MVASLIIFICTSLCLIASILFLPKIKIGKITLNTYWIVVLIGAVFILAFQTISINDVWTRFTTNDAANPFKILILFFSMTFLSIFLDEIGLFKYLAIKATDVVKNNQFKLFFIIYLMVSFLTIFTSNDIVILTFTPFICYFAKHSKINPIPYLVGEFVAANTWSMMFLIGNPTNIYLSSNAGLTFIDYFVVMIFPTLAAGFVEIGVLLLLFRKSLSQQISVEHIIPDKLNKLDLIAGLIALGSCLILLVLSNIIGIEMYLFSAGCAVVLLVYILTISIIRRDKFITFINVIKRLPYNLIPFVLGMFIIVLSLSMNNVSQAFENFFGETLVAYKYGFSSFIMCSLMNNIPMSMFYTSVCSTLPAKEYLVGVYSSVIGSNLGAFLTPIGALAGIMFTSLVSKQNIKYSFFDFCKYGALISIPTIAAALSTLMLVFLFI